MSLPGSEWSVQTVSDCCRLSPPVNGWDMYTQTWGMHGAHQISFLARYNPADGAMEVARFFLTR